MESKQKNILTLLLIVIIVIIVGIIGYLGFELINQNVKQKEAEKITDEFDSVVPTLSEEEILENSLNDENSDDTSGQGANSSSGGSASGGSSSGGSTASYSSGGYSTSAVNISGNWVAGTITIPATNIKYSIFADPTRQALEKGVGLIYTANGLNHVGNTVIAGHNYRNSLFFSKNKNLKIGDKIIIKDCTGLEITYSIYNKFTTTSADASFYQRETNGKREITLSTCTDQGTKTGERLIICAKEV